MICPHCGETASEWSRRCYNCGARIDNRPHHWMKWVPIFLVAWLLLSLWLAHH